MPQQQSMKDIEIQGVGVFQVPSSFTDEQVRVHIQNLRKTKPEIFVGQEAVSRGVKIEPIPAQKPRGGELSKGTLEGLGIPGGNIEQALADIPQGLKRIVTDPFGSAGLMANAAYEAQKEQLIGRPLRMLNRPQKNLSEAFTNKMLAVSHSMLGLIPMIGPIAGETSEAVGTGEITPARAIGRAAGMILGDKGMRGLSKVKAMKPVGEVPLLAGDTGGTLRSLGQQVIERSLPGSIPFEKFRTGQQVALLEKAERIRASLARGEVSAEAAGRSTISDLFDTEQALKTEARNKYRAIDTITGTKTARVATTETVPSSLVGEFGEALSFEKRIFRKVETGGVMAETASLKKFAIMEMRELRKLQKVIDPKILEQAEANLSAIIRSPKRVAFQTMQDVRSELLAVARRIDGAIGNKAQGISKRLAGLADEEMVRAAKDSGNPELLGMVREANDYWKEVVRKTEQTFDVIDNLATKRPEAVSAQLGILPLQGIRDLKAALRPTTLQNLKAAWLQEGLLKSISGETLRPELKSLSSLRGEIQVLNPKTFRNWLEGAGKKTAGEAKVRLSEIFNPGELAEIEGLLNDATKASSKKGGLFMPVFNVGMLAGAAAGIGQLLTRGDASLLGMTGATATTLYVMGKIMTKPEGIKALRQFQRAVGNAREEAFWMQRMAQIASKEEPEQKKTLQKARTP
jgi:hypothetical protein